MTAYEKMVKNFTETGVLFSELEQEIPCGYRKKEMRKVLVVNQDSMMCADTVSFEFSMDGDFIGVIVD